MKLIQPKFLKLYQNLPYDVRFTLPKMFYGHTHFNGMPGDQNDRSLFIKFATKILRRGLIIE